MKKLLAVISLLAFSALLYAQTGNLEASIRNLDQLEKEAVLKKDTTMLKKLWSSDFIVNAPINRVVKSGKSSLDRPVITNLSYSSFKRNTEQILLKDNVAFSMGSELVVLKGDRKTIHRRYTNIWVKENNQWKLAGRHANEICQKP